jgi:hypothetical protein
MANLSEVSATRTSRDGDSYYGETAILPTIRRAVKNKHHRHPKSQGGTGGRYKGQDFIVWVDQKKHEAWTKLFPGHMTPEDIFNEINNRWIDPRYRLVLERR